MVGAECCRASAVGSVTLKFAKDLSGLIRLALRAGMTEAKVCVQRGREAKNSKDGASLRRNMAGDGVAFVGIPRAKGFRRARKVEAHGVNPAATKILFLLEWRGPPLICPWKVGNTDWFTTETPGHLLTDKARRTLWSGSWMKGFLKTLEPDRPVFKAWLHH